MSRCLLVSRAGALVAMGAATVLVGCSTTIAVAVIGQHGETMTGTNTVGLSGGSFSVTDGKVTRSGSYRTSHRQLRCLFSAQTTDAELQRQREIQR